MRFSTLLTSALLALSLLGTSQLARAQNDDVDANDTEGAVPSGAARDDVKFSAEEGPMYIRIHDFRVTEVQPTGKQDEYALTLLALTTRSEPDQRVLGGILFDIDGKSTLVPFQQGGVGDVIVKSQPDAYQLTIRAVDSDVTHQIDLPRAQRMPWLVAGGAVLVILVVLARRRLVRAT